MLEVLKTEQEQGLNPLIQVLKQFCRTKMLLDVIKYLSGTENLTRKGLPMEIKKKKRNLASLDMDAKIATEQYSLYMEEV